MKVMKKHPHKSLDRMSEFLPKKNKLLDAGGSNKKERKEGTLAIFLKKVSREEIIKKGIPEGIDKENPEIIVRKSLKQSPKEEISKTIV